MFTLTCSNFLISWSWSETPILELWQSWWFAVATFMRQFSVWCKCLIFPGVRSAHNEATSLTKHNEVLFTQFRLCTALHWLVTNSNYGTNDISQVNATKTVSQAARTNQILYPAFFKVFSAIVSNQCSPSHCSNNCTAMSCKMWMYLDQNWPCFDFRRQRCHKCTL